MQIKIILPMCKISSGPLLSFIYSVIFNYSVIGQWRSSSDGAYVQTDLGLFSPDMSEDTFSHGTAHLENVNSVHS